VTDPTAPSPLRVIIEDAGQGGTKPSDWIAFGSLLLAALTVLVTLVNVRRQAEATIKQEHIAWLRDKRDALYRKILETTDDWATSPPPAEQYKRELVNLRREAALYAPEDVRHGLEDLLQYSRLRGQDAVENLGPRIPTPREAAAVVRLHRNIRLDLAGDPPNVKQPLRHEARRLLMRNKGPRT
jgi:hypothetical protein